MEALKKINPKKVVAIDIETVRIKENYNDLPVSTKRAWIYKTKHEGKELPKKQLEEEWNKRASLYAEFSKICAVSLVFINKEQINVKEFYGEENTLLPDLSDFLNRMHQNKFILIGHAAKYFDYPFLAKRYIINGIKIPLILDTSNKKPWEHTNLCTNELWKSFGTGAGSSLVALCDALNIPTSKSDIKGDEVGDAFYKGEIKRIVDYCTADTLAVFNVFLKLKGEDIFEIENLKKVEEKNDISLVEYVRMKNEIDDKAEKKIISFVKDLSEKEKDNLKKLFSAALGKNEKQKEKLNKII